MYKLSDKSRRHNGLRKTGEELQETCFLDLALALTERCLVKTISV